MKRSLFGLLSLSLLVGLCVTGCGPKKPDDFPEVVPATITVLRDGSPVADANVTFSVDGGAGFAVAGKTDGSGKAVLSTRTSLYAEEGAPVGNYIVTFEVVQSLKSEVPFEELAKMDEETKEAYIEKIQAEAEENRLNNPIPSSLRLPGDKTLEVEVPQGGFDMTVELTDYPHDPAVDEPKAAKSNDHP